MHFFGITVVIICKFFEVVKSNIIILMADCKNYLHTLSKKKTNFWISSFLAKIKGGRSPSTQKKQKFGPTEISGRCGGRTVQKSAEWQFRPYCTPILKEFSFQSKTKKVMLIESYVMPKNQKSWLPPPPFGTQCSISEAVFWDVQTVNMKVS